MPANNWFDINGQDKDIVVSTRVRLARNLKNFPFVGRLTAEQGEQIYNQILSSLTAAPDLAQQFEVIDLTRLTDTEKIPLVEQRLISPQFALGEAQNRVIISKDKGVSIMINEEDHLRLQVFGAGLCLEECLAQGIKLAGLVESSTEIAFSEKLGYLTACPTNLGTALRASAMLHLPALTRRGDVEAISKIVSKLGYTIRGIYGEGSNSVGDMYQLSNQITLGLDENLIITNLKGFITDIIAKERQAKAEMYARDPNGILDAIQRAVGVLTHCKLLPADEAMRLISLVRFGTALGVYEGIDFDKLNRLIVEIQPAHIASGCEQRPTEQESNLCRARLVKAALM